MLRRFFLFVGLVLIASQSFSQEFFHKTYGEVNNDVAYSLSPSGEEGVMVCGISSSFGNSKEIILMDISPDGEMLWSKAIGGKKADVGNKVKQTSDGGYVIVGNTSSFKAQRKDIYVVKLNQDGVIQWSAIYGGKNVEYGFDIEQTSDDGYILTGETNSFDVEDHDILVLKLNSQGSLEWGHTYGDHKIEFGQAIHETEGGYVLVGETNSFAEADTVENSDEGGINDIILMKLDYEGEVIWSNLYGGKDDDYVTDMIVDGDNGIFILGNTYSYGSGARDGLIIRTDNEGTLIQSKTLGNEGDEQLQSIHKVGDDGFIIGGFSNSHNDGLKKEDALIIRLTEKGTFRWSKTFGGAEDDLCLGAFVNQSHELFVAGGTNSFNKLTEQDMYVLKVNDERKMENCEMSTVQVVAIPLKPEEIHSEEVGLHHQKIEASFEFVESQSKDIELTETVLCESDELLVDDGSEKKSKKKKEDDNPFGDFGDFGGFSEEESSEEE